jgi:octaprenyl-diphosphate synthase|tara:strand:+ start:62 stop:1015 length:954 start_codon:yes stop_codon:yes gene_type:complete
MPNSYSIEKELIQVNNLIKNNIIEEETISNLYKYIFKTNGKQLRAKLALISSSNDKRLGKKRLQLASIIELLHTATLVHDDVVDESPTRRGIKSVNNIWSNSHGVLIGDYIYSKAFILMVELGNTNILDELSKATNDISKGELIQLDAINNKKITLSKLEDISYFKTGRLFEAAAKCGALLSRSDKKYQKSISDCAKNLGIVFQIKDDLLDYSQDESVTGKPALQDLREGKITYPFFFAYQNAKTNEKKQLELLLGKNKLNQKKTLNIINSLDGIKETENLALKYIKKSTKSALQIDNKNIREEMLNLLDAALYRKK